MVRTYSEQIYWQKDTEDGAIRQEVKKRFMDVLREDVQMVGVTEDRERWRTMICESQKKQAMAKEEQEEEDADGGCQSHLYMYLFYVY